LIQNFNDLIVYYVTSAVRSILLYQMPYSTCDVLYLRPSVKSCSRIANALFEMSWATFLFTLNGASRAFLTSQWRSLTIGQSMVLANYVIVTSKTLCSLYGAWKRIRPWWR